jgi:imidazole glycerol-phosphate synthase subunit HisF
MLKTRVIGLVLIRRGIAVQSIGFQRYLPLGRPEIAIEYLDRWGIDEIAVLDLDATERGISLAAEQVRRYARLCQVPLSVGGGIRSVDDVTRIIQAGADKVVVNSALLTSPGVITAAAERFGAQCLIASIDARRDGPAFTAFSHGGRRPAGPAAALARRAQELGAGEVLINSIDRDGTRTGYDLDLVRHIVGAVGLPVIACGGAGHPDHVREVIAAGPAAVALGNMLHYTEHSVIALKRSLEQARQPVRLDSYANYRNATLDAQGRIARLPDPTLDDLRFHYIPEEKI